jgi:hypothetical protein
VKVTYPSRTHTYTSTGETNVGFNSNRVVVRAPTAHHCRCLSVLPSCFCDSLVHACAGNMPDKLRPPPNGSNLNPGMGGARAMPGAHRLSSAGRRGCTGGCTPEPPPRQEELVRGPWSRTSSRHKEPDGGGASLRRFWLLQPCRQVATHGQRTKQRLGLRQEVVRSGSSPLHYQGSIRFTGI